MKNLEDRCLRLERTTSKVKISMDRLSIRMEGAEERIRRQNNSNYPI